MVESRWARLLVGLVAVLVIMAMIWTAITTP
jgi:hypothetical protein